jgi:hypothetical protein
MTQIVKNIFISHIHEDDSKLSNLKSLLLKNGMAIRDGSINSSNPNNAKNHEYIKREILAPQIKWASTMLVYISPKTKQSEWVNWEIEHAKKEGKRIIGIWEQGAKNCDIPAALKEYGDSLVGWNGNSIINAILNNIDKWEDSQGDTYPAVTLKRHPC